MTTFPCVNTFETLAINSNGMDQIYTETSIHSIGVLMSLGSDMIFEPGFSLLQRKNNCGYQKKRWGFPIRLCCEPCIYTWQMEALGRHTALSELSVDMQMQYTQSGGMSSCCKKASSIPPSQKK